MEERRTMMWSLEASDLIYLAVPQLRPLVVKESFMASLKWFLLCFTFMVNMET